MVDLRHARFASSPLFNLAGAMSLGILERHYWTPQSKLIFILSSALSVGLGLFSFSLAITKWSSTEKYLTVASAFLIAAFFCAGFTLSLISSRTPAPNRLARMYDEGAIAPGEPVEITGTLQGQPEAAPDSFYLNLQTETIRSKGTERSASGTVLLLAHAREQQVTNEYDRLDLRHGARVRVMTRLERDDDYRNPGVVPFTEYLEQKGYDATGVIKSPLQVERLDDGTVFLPLAWLYDWRARLQKEFAKRFSPEAAGVLDAALLGNPHNISHSAAERFRAGGTFHVLVISGLQIAFIGGLVLVIVRRFTKRRLLQFTLSAVFLWAYAIAVGAEASVVRSAVMFTIVVLASAISRRSNTLNALGAAAMALLVWRQSDLFDPSFQLTFLSVLAIVTIAVPVLGRMQQVGSWRPTHETPYPPACPGWFRTLSEALFWSERSWKKEMAESNIKYKLFKTRVAAGLERWHLQRPVRFAASAIVVSASVQIGMLPALIIYFHRVSFAALLLNIFVGVAMAAVALLALGAIILAQFSPGASVPLIWVAEKTNWLMVHSVDPFSRVGFASMRLPHYRGWAAGIYLLYFVSLIVLILALACWNPLRPHAITQKKQRPFRRSHVEMASVMFAVLLALILLHPSTAARPDGKLHVDFLDVGQGDCALVTMPEGTTLLIDGGGQPNIDWAKSDDTDAETFERDTRSIGERVVSEFLWARGLDRVDYILPTHADADHMDGLNDVARNFKIRGALVARAPANDPRYVRFAETMKTVGVPIEKVGAGDVMRFGGVALDVLWPRAATEVNAPYGNNDGLLLRLRYGDNAILFTADIEKPVETALLKSRVDLRSDVIKVAHHGSRTSSVEPFVLATKPSLAIISVGRTSIFGHPHKEVVERWRANGAQVMTTGDKGTISVVSDGRGIAITTYIKGR